VFFFGKTLHSHQDSLRSGVKIVTGKLLRLVVIVDCGVRSRIPGFGMFKITS